MPEEDILIKKYIKEILEKEKIKKNDLINLKINKSIINNCTNPFDEKLFIYAIKKQNKINIDYLFLIHCLKHFDLFNNLISRTNNSEEKLFLLTEIINNMNIINKDEKSYLFKLGENAEKFYFLINGEVTRLIPKKYETMMNKFEYFVYMKYLYKLEEIELFNLNLIANGKFFDKLETLHYILGDKNMKFQLDAINQLKFLEKSYTFTKLNIIDKNNIKDIKDIPFSSKCMIEIPKNINIEDLLKTDNIVPASKNNKKISGSVEDYIEKIMPIYIEKELQSKDIVPKEINLYKYILDKKINKNDYIEDIEDHITKRNSTVVCNTNCLFCFFPKKEYFNTIKEAQTKFHRNEMLFLLQNEIFNNLPLKVFDKRYFHLFKLLHMTQNKYLLTQGEKCDYIYFLKEGELSVSFNTNLNEVYRMIELKGGPKGRKEKDRNYLKRFYSAEFDDLYYKITSNVKLFNINENFPIGLEDYLDETNNDVSFFSVVCLRNSEIFAIKREDFHFILNREWQIEVQQKNYIKKRNKVLFERLMLFKNNFLQQITKKKYGIQINFADFEYISNCPNKDRKKNYKIDLPSPKSKNKISQKKVEVNYKLIRNVATDFYEENVSKIFENENPSMSFGSKNPSRICSSRIFSGYKESENKSTLFNPNNMNKRYSAKSKIINKPVLKNSNSSISGIDFNEFTYDKRTHKLILNPDTKSNDNLITKNENNNPRMNKSQAKLFEDPLDKIYQNLKSSVSLCQMKKNVNLKEKLNMELNNNKNNGYCITINLISPILPTKFTSSNKKILAPLRNKIDSMNVKMKEVNINSSKNKYKMLNTDNNDNNDNIKYYDKDNKIIYPYEFTQISKSISNYDIKKANNIKSISNANLLSDEKFKGYNKLFKNDLLSVLNLKKSVDFNQKDNKPFILPKINGLSKTKI